MIQENWSDEAEAGLIISAGADLLHIKNEVTENISQLFRMGTDGFTVLRYEREFKELVIVLGEGKNAKKWLPVIEDYARSIGANSIRTHITRVGLRRLYERIGFSQTEIVMGKKLWA